MKRTVFDQRAVLTRCDTCPTEYYDEQKQCLACRLALVPRATVTAIDAFALASYEKRGDSTFTSSLASPTYEPDLSFVYEKRADAEAAAALKTAESKERDQYRKVGPWVYQAYPVKLLVVGNDIFLLEKKRFGGMRDRIHFVAGSPPTVPAAGKK